MALRRMLFALLSICTAFPLSGAEEGERFRVIAYVRGDLREIDRYPLSHLTHMNYCFLHLKGKRLELGSERDSIGIARLVGLKAGFPHLKIGLSVGGWGGCEPCSEVFATAEGRREFAVSARDLLRRFGADGIDLDWEYPAVEGYPGHPYGPADRQNFTLLVEELRRVFGKDYEVTFAAGAFPKCLAESVEWDRVMPLVDYVNLMTYDFVNGYSTSTGHHTALFSAPGQIESTDLAVRFLDLAGVPRGKIVIGAAFYARLWSDVSPENSGLFRPGKFFSYLRFQQFDDSLGSSFTFFWDSTARAPYAYNAARRLFATFDDRRSIALKTGYALEKGLGGIMFWELTGDLHENGLLTTIAETLRGRERK